MMLKRIQGLREVLNKKRKTNVDLTKKEKNYLFSVRIAVFCNSQHSQPSRFFTYKLSSLVPPLIEWSTRPVVQSVLRHKTARFIRLTEALELRLTHLSKA
jgi:hypothetical protein